jgi:hypothetical protein
MFSKTKIALCAALILGTASAALASNENTNDQSVSEAQAAREARGPQLPWWWNTPAQGRGNLASAANAYGYVASFPLFAMSLASANGAPLHNNNHHHSRGGYVAASKPPASLSTGAWTTTTREPVEIFGRKVDP